MHYGKNLARNFTTFLHLQRSRACISEFGQNGLLSGDYNYKYSGALLCGEPASFQYINNYMTKISNLITKTLRNTPVEIQKINHMLLLNGREVEFKNQMHLHDILLYSHLTIIHISIVTQLVCRWRCSRAFSVVKVLWMWCHWFLLSSAPENSTSTIVVCCLWKKNLQ